MKAERKYTTPVSMFCSKHNYDVFLKEEISKLGYTEIGLHWQEWEDSIMVNLLGEVSTADVKRREYYKTEHLQGWSHELFLALAACSEGEEFFPGEIVIVNDRGVNDFLIVTEEIQEEYSLCVKRLAEKNDLKHFFKLPCSIIHKASKEEIIAHLSKKQEQPQQEDKSCGLSVGISAEEKTPEGWKINDSWVGMWLKCVNECIVQGTNKQSLTLGKLYKVEGIDITKFPETCFYITDDQGIRHYFDSHIPYFAFAGEKEQSAIEALHSGTPTSATVFLDAENPDKEWQDILDFVEPEATKKESEWMPIEGSPKYPIDQNYNGPHFLIRNSDGYVQEAWWSFPHPLSQNYRDNAPPSIQISVNNTLLTEKPKLWARIPV